MPAYLRIPILIAFVLLPSATFAQWRKALGPPHGVANDGQINTRVVADREWKLAFIGWNSAGSAELYKAFDSLQIVRADYDNEVAFLRPDSVSSICINKPNLPQRIPFFDPRILSCSYYPLSTTMSTLGGGGPVVPEPPVGVNDIAAETDSTFICVGADRVLRFLELRTSGRYSTVFTAPILTRFRAVACPSSGVIIAAGLRGVVYKSINRGQTFVPSNTGIAATADIRQLSFPTADTGYAATSLGIYRTINAGTSWVLLPGTTDAKEVSFFLGREGYYLARTGTQPVFKTQDAGETWTAQPISSKPGSVAMSLSTMREGHCFVLIATQQVIGTRQDRDSVYFYYDPSNRVVSNKPTVAQRIAVYPNPAHQVAEIEGIKPTTTWALLTLTGQTAQTGSGPRLPIEGLPKGMYLLQVAVAHKTTMLRVVVE